MKIFEYAHSGHLCRSSIAIVTALLLVVFAMLSVVVLSTSFSVSHPTINNTWIDGGANTMCVDNATGLMGPRLGIYFHFWEPHPGHITTSDDCKLACSKQNASLQITSYVSTPGATQIRSCACTSSTASIAAWPALLHPTPLQTSPHRRPPSAGPGALAWLL